MGKAVLISLITNKEIGKRMFWDWKGGTNMKGVMSLTKRML
jgi:hypothetical protein